MLRFEWDPWKAERNLRTHGVSFELAERIFDDPDLVYRRDYFEGELRDHAIGSIGFAVLLLVVHTVIDEDEEQTTIRIISAWVAGHRDRAVYREARS